MKDYEEKYCVICGREFVPTRGNQVTCSSPRCKHERHKRQCIKWRDNNRDAVRESNRKHMRRKREEPVIRKDTLIAIGYAERQREQTLRMVGRVKVERNTMRMIDADALIKQLKSSSAYNDYEWAMYADGFIEDIENAPSIDIVRRKPVVGYEGYYEVDMYGNVYSVARTVQVNDNGRIYDKPVKEKKLTASKHSCGYRTVALTRNGKTEQQYIHRIVAEAYIPNPQNLPYINHKDEDKTNNFVGNLEWCTASYNNTYNGKNIKHSEKLKGRKFTEEHKEKIRQSNIGKHHKGEREGE